LPQTVEAVSFIHWTIWTADPSDSKLAGKGAGSNDGISPRLWPEFLSPAIPAKMAVSKKLSAVKICSEPELNWRFVVVKNFIGRAMGR